MLVKSDLEKLNIVYKYVELGEAELEESISNETYEKLLWKGNSGTPWILFKHHKKPWHIGGSGCQKEPWVHDASVHLHKSTAKPVNI